MSDLFLELIDEMDMDEAAERGDGFTIDNDQKAEWAMRKIRDDEEEYKRIEAVCKAEIERYLAVISDAMDKRDRRTGNLRALLAAYIRTVKTRDTKMKSTYTLASGKLVVTRKQPKVIRDDEKLLHWMRENAPEYITEKVSYSPAWATLKDTLIVDGDEYMTRDGLIVDGVRLEAQPDEFNIVYT